jgi:hypothetical protein
MSFKRPITFVMGLELQLLASKSVESAEAPAMHASNVKARILLGLLKAGV